MTVTLTPVAGQAGMHSVIFEGGGAEMSIRLAGKGSLEVRSGERVYSRCSRRIPKSV